MRKTLLVMRQELINTFRRPSYLIFAFGVPIVAVLVLGGVKLIQGRSTGSSATVANFSGQSTYQLVIEGFIDHSGLIETIPTDIRPYLRRFENEADARQAMDVGQIEAYYRIPADYMAHGEVEYVYPDDRSYLSDGQKWVIQWVMNVNLLDGDIELADLIWNPVWQLDAHSLVPETAGAAANGEDCSRPGEACKSNQLVRYMPSLLVALFFMVFMSSSSMLFNSVGIEKENRTIELLLLSINPRQLLAGKTLALGSAGLSQTVIWLAAIYISFNIGGSTISLPDDFTFPVGILIWGLLFFIAGFGLYASLMAGAGALVPKMKEAGAANFIAMAPLLFGYIFGIIAPLAEASESAFLVFLSIFPLTSPVVMVMRLTAGSVPLWQLLLTLGLLCLTAYYALNMVAAMFHAQNLLSGQPFSVRRYLRAMVGRS